MEKEIGSLEAGKKGDLVLIGLDAPNTVPMYDVYAQLAVRVEGNDVETGHHRRPRRDARQKTAYRG